MSGFDGFKRVSRPAPKGSGYVAFQQIVCGSCGGMTETRAGKANPLPFKRVAEVFRAAGWKIGPHRAQDRCPTCLITARTLDPHPLGPPQVTPKGEPAMTTAEPPRQPAAEDKRRIRDKLDELYDEDAGRYRQAHSDKSVAALLVVPAKWVADIREAMGMGPDVNEAAEQRETEIAQVRTLCAEASALALQAVDKADEAERKMRKLGLDAGYAG